MLKAVKGTKDILPQEVYKWQYIDKVLSEVSQNFGYKEIRLPVFEYTDLFQRGVGDTTDIVQKEMYTFLDKGGRSITLRPEGTAGVVRSYIENGMASQPQPIKLFYNITAYRYENVQKGRYREFHQFGVEAFGTKDAAIDVEIISLADVLFKKLGIRDTVSLNINSMGCLTCRSEYNKKLSAFLEPHLFGLCSLCRDRFGRNPLRILDCKEEKCKNISKNTPSLIDCLCEDCNDHFEELKNGLDNLGIKYKIDKNIVRGLDYYTNTVFEFVSDNIGAQGTVCGGGRYNKLIESFGANETPGIGFAIGLERLLMVMEAQGAEIFNCTKTELYIASIGEAAQEYAQRLAYQKRQEGKSVEIDLSGRSLKAQLKHADKIQAKFSIVLGENEIISNKAILKNMITGEQREINLLSFDF